MFFLGEKMQVIISRNKFSFLCFGLRNKESSMNVRKCVKFLKKQFMKVQLSVKYNTGLVGELIVCHRNLTMCSYLWKVASISAVIRIYPEKRDVLSVLYIYVICE